MNIHLPPAEIERLFDVRNYLGSAEEFVRQVLAEVGSTATVN